ncbi:MAG TPA: NAD(P)/FAD-dependent oxidoreductase [Lysobacter sp.]|nr:NAD(P)/FAD-dependent oxidoreductase [Lysobacter sp.]
MGISYEWDVVVAGAGFAGAACALAAAHHGLRVLVLERKHDPGERLHTTGIIVKEAAERTWLNRLPADLTRRIERVRLYSPRLRHLDLGAPGYYFLTTDTPGVMRWLADELVRHGVELRLGRAFTQAERDGSGWNVADAGRTRYLVGADGARSRVAARFGLGQEQDHLLGVEYEFAGLTLADPDALHCFVSRQYAPGYIGWLAQNPTGVQAGIALRPRQGRPRRPDLDGFLRHIGPTVGLPPGLRPSTVRAGPIPCGGAVRPLAGDGVILTGDAAGIVSPVTAGGIHSAWEHGWRVGEAIAAHLLHGGPPPEHVAVEAAPTFRRKRALRWAFDRFQMDWPFDLLLYSLPLRWAAELVYFHRRGNRLSDV